MKLGFVSAILDYASFEETIEIASKLGYECLEVACWPKQKAVRRYAGVTHIDVDELDEEKIIYVKDLCAKNNIEISSLAYYPNTLDPDLEKRSVYVEHLKKMISIAPKLGVNTISTFIGRIQEKNIQENLEVFKEVWTPIIDLAEECGVRIAIENCPMLFTKDEWPGGQNLATTPKIWRQMFELIDSKYLGLNYDPSHFVWQNIDYIKPLYEFKDKIFHVHYKDIKIYKDKLDDVGIMAYPLEFMSPKLPGLGDVDWGRYVSALTDIGFDGYSCVEIEDKAFEDGPEAIERALKQSYKYLRQFVI